MLGRRRGFTLIEALVVMALIGILAAITMPVFVRAREAARKVTCLSNMKNVVAAVQMYMADNDDTMGTTEHRREVRKYFEEVPGQGDEAVGTWCIFNANPYLRYPVLLDEYVKNRQVWRCPSEKLVGGAAFILPGPDWFGYLLQYEGTWGIVGGGWARICNFTWPPGWGGEVTDTLVQHRMAMPEFGVGEVARGAFRQSIDVTFWPDLRLVSINDPTSFITVVESGAPGSPKEGLGCVSYPDICALECGNQICSSADWGNPFEPGDRNRAPRDGSLLATAAARSRYARHSGGVNIGFLDGHVAWMNSETVIQRVRDGELAGTRHIGPTSDCGFSDYYPGVPTIY